MHELSIALSIVDLIEEESRQRGGRHVKAVHLTVGRLSGIVTAALVSSFELACEQTVAAGAHLVVKDAPILTRCATCNDSREVRSALDMRCCDCGAPAGEIIGGRELLVTALEMEP